MQKKIRAADVVFDTLNVILMIAVFIIMVYPFYYVVLYSISEPSKLSGGLILLPGGVNITSYVTMLKMPETVNGFFVSVARTVLGTAGMVFVTSMAAYAISKDELVGIKFFRRFFVFTMYFSGGLIPGYILLKNLHLTGSFLVYILPGLVGVFNMVLIKTYIESLPKGLEDSAMIDGANEIKLFFQIILPICKPVIAAVALFSCVGHWNSFIDTQLYCAMNPKLYTLQYVLYNILSTNTYSLEQAKMNMGQAAKVNTETMKMAITVITVIPIMFAYPFLQKQFISGLMIGSIKG